ncbi:MAG: hypothetical protein M1816_007206 [Peltula sp. TS41687]|nr:MAG: hypothetical protein M1816_007206 [Peltula sp. TS41687]
MAGVAQAIYNTLYRNNAVFLGAVFLGAFGFEIGFDSMSNRIWDGFNRGVSWKRYGSGPGYLLGSSIELIYDDLQRQWKDIRDRYVDKE